MARERMKGRNSQCGKGEKRAEGWWGREGWVAVSRGAEGAGDAAGRGGIERNEWLK